MEQEKLENIKAIIEFRYHVFGNEDEFSICKYKATYDKTLPNGKTISFEDTITVKGNNLPHVKGLAFDAELQPIEDKKYGLQYNLICATPVAKKGKEGTIAYFTGIVKGLGKKKAELIYEKFGEDSVRVFEEEPLKLMTIKGISRKSIDKWVESYKEHTVAREVYSLLSSASIPVSTCTKIANSLGSNAVAKIRENPYCISNISGIGFYIADKVGRSLGMPENAPERINAGAVSVLSKFMSTGSVGMPYDIFLEELIKEVGLSRKSCTDLTLELIKDKKLDYKRCLYKGKEIFYIYIPFVKRNEEQLAKSIVQILKSSDSMSVEAEKALKKLKGASDLDPSQREAVIKAYSAGVSVITGGPGTGKTTTIKMICGVGEELGYKDHILLMSPTGKAARRMSECSDRFACTIHSGLNIIPKSEDNSDYIGAEDSKCDEIADSLIIVDEFSMVDMWLATTMFTKTNNCRFIFVGDADQLPSVGCGNVLHDIIESEVVPCTMLKYCHRQDEGSTIAYNANLLKDGVGDLIPSGDFEIITVDPDAKMDIKQCLYVCEEKMVEYYKQFSDAGKDVMCLSPFHKNEAGVIAVNNRVQDKVNSKESGLIYSLADGRSFRKGDLVMHIKKNHGEDDVYNGDVGTVSRIFYDADDGDELTIEVRFDSKSEPYFYTKRNIDELTLAYALTVHKSQGSEYDTVIVCLTRFHRVMLRRNILYTAITRAKKKVILITSDKQAIESAARNNQTDERYTLLAKYIRDEYYADSKALAS